MNFFQLNLKNTHISKNIYMEGKPLIAPLLRYLNFLTERHENLVMRISTTTYDEIHPVFF